MPDHAKEYSFNVIEFAMRAGEGCFGEFECRRALVGVLRLGWVFAVVRVFLWGVRFARLGADWRGWACFRVVVCVFSLNEQQKVYSPDENIPIL